jgi:ATP-binding protein involved in chromosome partitioning
MATELGVDYLGALPLDINIRLQADMGRPTVVADPTSQAAEIYKDVARRVAAKVSAKAKDFSSKFPTIKISKAT